MPDIAKDPKQYPQFNEVIASDLRTSLDLFLEEVIGSDAADFRQLLGANYVYLNGRLSQFYGADLSGRAVPKGLSGSKRARGVLTHPYLMSSFAYTASSSPIHRGVFCWSRVTSWAGCCDHRPRPSPRLAPDLHPDLTTAPARVTLQTKVESCQSCHGMINPLDLPWSISTLSVDIEKMRKGRPIDAPAHTRPARAKWSSSRESSCLRRSSPAAKKRTPPLSSSCSIIWSNSQSGRYGPQTLPNLRRFFAAPRFQSAEADGRNHRNVGFDVPRDTVVNLRLSRPGMKPPASRLLETMT